MMPKVSVVIPTYNRGNEITETIESVLAQTYKDFEIIVVNDGSTDNSAEVLTALQNAGKIRYVSQENAGPSKARNRGLAEVKGEYVAFLDDDDLWPPDKLQWQVEAMEFEPKLVAVYGKFEIMGKEHIRWIDYDNAPGGMIREEFCKGNYVGSPGVAMIRTASVKSISGFDVALAGAADWDLWIRLSDLGPSRFVNRVALRYRLHGNNMSSHQWPMYKDSMLVVRKHFHGAGKESQARAARQFIKTFVVNGYMEARRKSLKQGQYFNALMNAVMATYIDPKRILSRLIARTED
jgi:glycosyltransferase involved in cell wall biosynthesis